MIPNLILASGSPFRRQLMEAAGLAFEIEPARIDERAVEAPLVEAGATPDEVAASLASAKARDVAAKWPGKFIVGSDQVMSMDGDIFHKCRSVEDARRQLRTMRGRTHKLSSAVSIFHEGAEVWRHVATASMTFRDFSDTFLEHYMDRAGTNVLLTVGAYSFEGLGLQLFERVAGDYFTIIGLPMLPLLAALRDLNVIER